jgi:hypothetical protein
MKDLTPGDETDPGHDHARSDHSAGGADSSNPHASGIDRDTDHLSKPALRQLQPDVEPHSPHA